MTNMSQSPDVNRPANNDLLILAGLSFALFLYLVLVSVLSGYGYFIDEFYYIACAKRLAFGYVDHPPLSIFLLALVRRLIGDSLVALRILPALAHAATVFITGLITRRLGGSRTAMIIAALAVMVMPVFLLMGSFYSMNAFEPLILAVILYLVIKLVQEENPKYWFVIGLLLGIGLEMKHTMILYGMAFMFGMLVTNARRYLRSKWLLFGIFSSFLLLLPNLIWQFVHGFPSLEFYRNALLNKNIATPPLKILLDQVFFANPFAFPLWIAGLLYLLFSAAARKYRFLAWTSLFLFAAMLASGASRPDRISFMYTYLFAAGGITVEKCRPRWLRRGVAAGMVGLLCVGGFFVAPLVTPLFPPHLLKQYIARLGISFDIESGKRNEPIPQWLADRLGWKELAADVAGVYQSIPAAERKNTVIISTNYGEAGALELFGPEFGLPPVFATHNSYHSWGPPPDSSKTYICVFVDRRDLEDRFASVSEAAIHTCADCTRPQRSIPIYVARGPRFSITKEWPKFKQYD